jgi:hypothetical protein
MSIIEYYPHIEDKYVSEIEKKDDVIF